MPFALSAITCLTARSEDFDPSTGTSMVIIVLGADSVPQHAGPQAIVIQASAKGSALSRS